MAYNMLYTVLARTRQDLLCLAKVLPLLWPISCERAAFTESTDLPPEAPAPAIPVGKSKARRNRAWHPAEAMRVAQLQQQTRADMEVLLAATVLPCRVQLCSNCRQLPVT
jgi:hypothetical protein